ncbi:MAG: SprT family zinc-dependent metalloprotease [Anaerolineales bacterium]|jgi:predicted metal-dependent hydrolase|nr:SprT family zinc-dependent metalloprotease [Anaerolineales bacterium]
MHTLQYGSTSIPYRLTYTERASLAIHVHPDLSVSVEAPLGSDPAEIEKRLHKRAAWILRQQRDFRRYSLDFPPRQYVSGESHRYLGQQYRLKVLQSADKNESILLEREQLLVTLRDKSDPAHVRRLVQGWYRQRAYEIYSASVSAWFPHFARFNVPQPSVQVRQMRSRWGSCTAGGKITLNLKLVMLPRQLIDYVIVHELCHLVEHNHGKGFYDLLSRIMPDWEYRRRKLEGFDFG